MDGESRWKEDSTMLLKDKLKHYRLSQSEYEIICQKLQRPPKGVEWAIFSALWSEHCSYKSSKKHLKKLFSKHPRVLHGSGENAGVIDLGEGEKIAFKIESHNHPSLIEPYQGAATGVGGILRDIFTMGARPIALANYLCFGDPPSSHTQKLLNGVVEGIADYGNCVGVAMLTGQTEFNSGYNNNIVMNALALGYFGQDDQVFLSHTKNTNNLVIYVGAKTGRDGIHGASMASQPSDDNIDNKPTVQIGDPFFEKLLIESCLEAMKAGLVEAIQDMGASGLTSSSFEMAAKSQIGMKLFLDQVPLREQTLTPEDILLSESQERMLILCQPENLKKLQKIFTRWDLEAQQIGYTTDDYSISLYWHGKEIIKINPDLLVQDVPEYDRPYHQRNHLKCTFPEPSSKAQDIFKILSNIQGCSRHWIFQQYDKLVGANTHKDCSWSLGVLKLPESQRNLAIVLGGRPHIMQYNAFVGGHDAILYPAIKLAIKGFEPLAVTNCLNFGNPENKKIMTQFVDTIEGMNAACKSLNTPIVSGNVSFYNEFKNQNILPTPAIGMIGLRENSTAIPKDYIVQEGLDVLLLEFLYNAFVQDHVNQMLVQWILELQKLCSTHQVKASRIVSRWGIGYTLCKMCCHLNPIEKACFGIELLEDIPDLFSEKFYQVIIIIAQEHKKNILKKFNRSYCRVQKIGQTGGDAIRKRHGICWKLNKIQKAYFLSLKTDAPLFPSQ